MKNRKYPRMPLSAIKFPPPPGSGGAILFCTNIALSAYLYMTLNYYKS